MEMTIIETSNLQLKPVELNDAPSLFAYWSDPVVSKYMNIEAFTDITQAEQMILLLQKLCLEKTACRWTIFLKSTGQIIGSCGFNYFDFENERAEIGYDLGYPFWGNGYVPEALQSLISFGFHDLGLNRIEAKVEPENINSIKVLKKLHFVEEGTLRQYEKAKGKLVDLSMFSVLRTDWKGDRMPEITIHKNKMIFGWENDNGIGEMLIQQIFRGEKNATCSPKELYSEEELKQTYEPVGEIVTVYDKHNNPRCNVRLKEVFETTFGNPDLKLVQGEGNGDNVIQFQEDHKLAWRNIGIDLRDETILIVELFELINE